MGMHMMLLRDREFLAVVRSMADVGYGRMMQIVSREWYRGYGLSAHTTGPCIGTLSEPEQDAYEWALEHDPIFQERD